MLSVVSDNLSDLEVFTLHEGGDYYYYYYFFFWGGGLDIKLMIFK